MVARKDPRRYQPPRVYRTTWLEVNGMAQRTCGFDGCERPHKARGLCKGHSDQRTKDQPLKPLAAYLPPGLCSFPECGRKRIVRGLCAGHLAQENEGRTPTPLVLHLSRRGKPQRNVEGFKRCTKCGAWLPDSEFAKSSHGTDGLRTECMACLKARYRRRSLRVRYNISVERYDEMLAAQDGKCAICDTACTSGKFLAVDHDHSCCPTAAQSCGECIRGLICLNCNLAIGNMNDDPARLRAAADYLERART